jgi:hypothetical protein
LHCSRHAAYSSLCFRLFAPKQIERRRREWRRGYHDSTHTQPHTSPFAVLTTMPWRYVTLGVGQASGSNLPTLSGCWLVIGSKSGASERHDHQDHRPGGRWCYIDRRRRFSDTRSGISGSRRSCQPEVQRCDFSAFFLLVRDPCPTKSGWDDATVDVNGPRTHSPEKDNGPCLLGPVHCFFVLGHV